MYVLKKNFINTNVISPSRFLDYLSENFISEFLLVFIANYTNSGIINS